MSAFNLTNEARHTRSVEVSPRSGALSLAGSLFLGCLLLCEIACAAPSSLPREDFWVTDGPVRAMAETNGRIYIGGRFEYISPVSETGHAFDRFSGTAFPGFPQFAGAIKAILHDGEGGWFVGGQFTAVGGYPMTNLAHVHADMTLDTNWAPHPNGPVLALAMESPRLFVGGTFDEIGGKPHALLAALNPTNGTLLSWRADCTSGLPSPSVNALVATNGVLYVSGLFSKINGVAREHIGSVETASTNVTDWFPNDYNGSQISSRIDAMAIAGNLLYVGGTFASIGGNTSSNGPSRLFLAALDVTRASNSVVAWNPSANGPVTAIAVECDTVYIAGSFTQVAGQPRRHLAAVAIQTGALQPWNPDADGDVLTLKPAGNTIYVGGKFTRVGGQPRNFIAALETDTGEATFWKPKADFGVAHIGVSGGTVVSGGVLGPGGKLRKNVAAFDARTGQPLDWAPLVTGSTTVNAAPVEGVYALAASATAVYLGGPFAVVNGAARNHIAAVDASTGALLPWNPNINGIVHALAVHRTVVYAGGQFDRVGGTNRTNLAAVDETGVATKWNPGPNGKVTVVARHGSTVYVGGLFTALGQRPRNRVGALSASSGRATGWNPDANDSVSALAISQRSLYVGGGFTELDGEPRRNLAEVSRLRSKLTCWAPEPRLFTRAGEGTTVINALTIFDGAIYAGGSFTRAAGEPRPRLAALQPECPATATPWAPELDDAVNTIVATRYGLAAGGIFKAVNGRYRPNFAIFPPEGAPTIVDHPLSQSPSIGQSITLTANADGEGALAYQWQFNGTNIAGANAPALTLLNAQPADSGDYVLVVTNQLGLIQSRPATVDVLQPIQIVSQPESQTVAAGTTLVLNVQAIGHPSPIYQWRLNGVNIPGAVNAAYTISNATPQDGGSYEVVVANNRGAVISDVATLIVTSPPISFSDEPENATLLPTLAGVGSGSNAGATVMTNETHAGKRGGHSVWVAWTAPSAGVAVFDTRGSAFDTLLGIYALSSTGRVEVASDEDAGGFHTSKAAFNAIAGSNYWIAVDGFGGATGHITLTWTFEAGVPAIPRFITQPFDQSVFVGSTVSFISGVATNSPVTYQWFRNCEAIPGATNATLTLTDVTFDDVANYRVVAEDQSSNVVESAVASLEIGPVPSAFSHDKLEDLLAAAEAEEALASARAKATVRPTAFIPVTVGTIGSQRLNNSRAGTQRGEPLICGTLGGASKWFGLRAKANGTMVIDTLGSRIGTLLSAYRRTNLFALSTNLLACDTNSAPDGLGSVVQFEVVDGQDILVTVDGVNRQRGAVALNWTLLTKAPSPLKTRTDKSLMGLAQSLSIVRRPSEGLSVTVFGSGTNRSVLESSTDLQHWTSIYTNPPHQPPVILKFPIHKTGQEFFRIMP